MVVVSDSGPLIALSKIGRFDLLKLLFGKIYVPMAVYREVAIEGEGKPGAKDVKGAVEEGWITKREAQDSLVLTLLKVDLADGEAEALVLASDLNADLLLIDEHKGRIRAEQMQLEIMGTIGVLLLARKKGISIDLRSALDELRGKGFRISDRLYERMLKGL